MVGHRTFAAVGPVTIAIEARNVAVGLTVTVRIVPKTGGTSFVLSSTALAGTFELSTATALLDFSPPGPYEVYLSLQLP